MPDAMLCRIHHASLAMWSSSHPPFTRQQSVFVGNIPLYLDEDVFLRQIAANGIHPLICRLRQGERCSSKFAILTFKTETLAKACLAVNEMLVGKGEKIRFQYLS